MAESNNSTAQNRFFYSTYSSDIYSEAKHSAEDENERKVDGKHIQHKKHHWSSLSVIFNVRMIIIIFSVIIVSTFFSSIANDDPKSERFKIGKIIAPPNIFEIKELQVPSVGSVVSKRVIFNTLIENIKSSKLASRFSNDNLSKNFYTNLIFKKSSKDFETADSVQISIISEYPEVSNKWLNGFLTFASSQTIAYFAKKIESKIDDKRDKITLSIDNIHREIAYENSELNSKIKKYKKAIVIAKRKGIVNPISVKSIPIDQRFGDLLYLQGYWKLEAEIKRLEKLIENTVVDVSGQQEILKNLEKLFPNIKNVKSFYLEKNLAVKNLNSSSGKQVVWSIVGGFVGLIIGLIISYPFRRKKIS